MKGSGYIFGFLIPSSILLFIGLYMAFTAKKIAKISAGMQIDSRVRNKLEKRRGLQINLFIRVSKRNKKNQFWNFVYQVFVASAILQH